MGRFQYTGQQWLPELGMYYYKARLYSPTLGRFMQTDPIGYNGGINIYAYTGGDPVNFTDPSGLVNETDCKSNPTICPLISGPDPVGQNGEPTVQGCPKGTEGVPPNCFDVGPAIPVDFSGGQTKVDFNGDRFQNDNRGGDPPQKILPPKNCTVSSTDSAASGGVAAAAAAIPEYGGLAAKVAKLGLRSTIIGVGEEAAATGGLEGAIALLGGPVTLGAVAIGAGVYAYDRYSGGAVTKFINRTSDKLGVGIKIGNGCE